MTQNVITTWLEEQARLGRSSATIDAYRRGLRHFMRWYVGAYGQGFDVNSVMPRDIRDWRAHQQTVEKAAPATINQRLVAVHRFFRWAAGQGLATENPANDVRHIHLPPRQPKGLRHDQLRRLLRAARHHRRDYAILEVLLGTGLRVGELLALQVSDITLSERSGILTVRKGKHGQYRQIPLTNDVRRALRAYLDHDHPEATNENAPLWIGPQGGIRHRSTIKRLLEKYASQAGIDLVNPHALRHSFATRYLEANPDDLRGLARLLGHSSLNTVMIYTEPSMKSLLERLERVETRGVSR